MLNIEKMTLSAQFICDALVSEQMIFEMVQSTQAKEDLCLNCASESTIGRL